MQKGQAWIIRNAHLWMDNEEPLYRKRFSWEENIKRKILNGKYERSQMIPAIEKYLLPDILTTMRDHGEFTDTEFENVPIPKHIKHAIAVSLTRSIEAEARIRASRDLDKPSMLKKRGFILAKKGYNGVVRGPTKFLAGEAGPEKVIIKPLGRKIKSPHGNSIRGNRINFPNLGKIHTGVGKNFNKEGVLGNKGIKIKFPKVSVNLRL